MKAWSLTAPCTRKSWSCKHRATNTLPCIALRLASTPLLLLTSEQYETVVHSDRPDSPVVYMIPLKMKTIEKSNQDFLADWQSSLKQTSLVVPS